jgi:hypothetical protein
MIVHATRKDGEECEVMGVFGDKKLVLRIDGQDFVLASVHFNVVVVWPNGTKLPISWLEVESDGIGWRGGVIRGGQIHVYLRNLRILPKTAEVA